MTLSEAARRGFFELVAVSALVIIVVLIADAVAPHEATTVVRWSAGLVSLTMIVWLSAMGRMAAYINSSD